MATEEDAQQAILDKIEAVAKDCRTKGHSEMVRNLAEAYAWMVSPAQPHGSSGSTISTS